MADSGLPKEGGRGCEVCHLMGFSITRFFKRKSTVVKENRSTGDTGSKTV